MNTRERLKKMLVDQGMFDNQAEEVLSRAIPKIEIDAGSHKISWGGPSDGYPDQMYAAWWLPLRDVALEWINENAPQAWYKSMFE